MLRTRRALAPSIPESTGTLTASLRIGGTTMNTSIVDRQTEMLRWTYGLVPIAAGADKFTNLLTDWSKYLSPRARELLPVSPRTFMRAVGVIEIAAGALVLDRKTSRLGAYVVGGWLGAIALNLIANRSFDIAVRDLAMGIGAISLARLLTSRDEARREAQRQRSATEYSTPAPAPRGSSASKLFSASRPRPASS